MIRKFLIPYLLAGTMLGAILADGKMPEDYYFYSIFLGLALVLWIFSIVMAKKNGKFMGESLRTCILYAPTVIAVTMIAFFLYAKLS